MYIELGAATEDQKDHLYLKCQGVLQLVNQWITGFGFAAAQLRVNLQGHTS